MGAGLSSDTHRWSLAYYQVTTQSRRWRLAATKDAGRVLSGTQATVSVQTETGVTRTFDFRAGTWKQP